MYNPLAFIVLPILLFVAGFEFFKNSKILRTYWQQRQA